MPLTLSPITELDAVNTMLSGIGEQPANTLETSGVSEVSIARDLLHRVSRMVQARGLHCNSEENYPLPRDINGKIPVPANCLKVDSEEADVVLRGGFLYDKEKHTNLFDQGLNVDIVLFLSFEDLPQTVRDYITIKAARMFQVQVLGSDTLSGLTANDEMEAWLALQREEFETGDYNMLQGGDLAGLLQR